MTEMLRWELYKETCSPVSDKEWFVLDGGPLEKCTLCLGSELETRGLHVLSTAQAHAESSVTAWSTRLCGWLVCLGRTSQGAWSSYQMYGGIGLDGVILLFLFYFF